LTAPSAVDRFAGAVVGQCVGDALGFMVEGEPPADCRRYIEDIVRAGRAVDMSRGYFRFGQYTDDSQLARELMQSYAECRGFDPADYARRIAAIFTEDRIVGRGRTTEAAALRLAAGVPWQEAGTPAPAAGNGSAMRAGPIGLMFHDDPAARARAAHDQGRITHADPRCSAGAVAIAEAVALALGGGPIAVEEFVGRLAAAAAPFDGSVANELAQLGDRLVLPPQEAGPIIARAGLQPGFSDRWQGISPYVTSSVLWSLYSFLRTPDDYFEIICTAIAVGGDVDTTAAMAGAIAGARLGLAEVPADLAHRLNDRGNWGYDALVDLAHRVHAIACSG